MSGIPMRYANLYGLTLALNVLFHAITGHSSKTPGILEYTGATCESVTAPLPQYESRPTDHDFTDQNSTDSAPRLPPEDCTHGQCPQDPDRGRRYRTARYRWPRSCAQPAQGRLQGSHHHAHRTRYRFGHDPRARIRRQRLRRKAVSFRRAAGADPGAAPPA